MTLIGSYCGRCYAAVGVPEPSTSTVCRACELDGLRFLYSDRGRDRGHNLGLDLTLGVILKQIRNAPYTEIASFKSTKLDP